MRMWTCLTLFVFAAVFVAGCGGEKAEETLQKATEEVKGAAETAGEAVQEAAETMGEHAEGAMSEMTDKMKELLGADGEEMMGKLSTFEKKVGTMKTMAATAGNEELDGYLEEAESQIAGIKEELGGLEGKTAEEVAAIKEDVAKKLTGVEDLIAKSGDVLGELKEATPDLEKVKETLPGGH